MATFAEIRQQYPQYSDMPDADLAAALHKKFYADMPKEDFDRRLGLSAAKDDPIKAEVRKEYEEQKRKGVPLNDGYARAAIQGATMNAADDILAAMATPIEMFRRKTLNPVEAFKYAKAWEDIQLEEARKNTGALGTAAEIGGGVMSGAGLARGGASLFNRLTPNAGLGARTAASAGDAALMGGAAGFMEGNSLSERTANAGIGALAGGAVGFAAPAVAAIGGATIAPILSNIRARVNPRGVAEAQTARAIQESGRPVADIADDIARAAQEGQPMFTVADALGNPGQRMLSNVARAPGVGRTEVVNFLEQRQADQGRRVANALAEGFDAPQTATQTRANLTAARSADADVNYGAARQAAGSVNVSPAIDQIDRTLQPGVTRFLNPQSNIADDSVEGVLRRARSMLTDGRSQVSRFDEAHRIKMELDNLIDRGSPTQQRVLIPVRNALDNELARASQPYAAARLRFRQQSQAIDAIEEGRTAAMRGRAEDTIQTFRSMRPDQQASYRVGYADPLIEQAQGAAYGVNKARPFTSDAFRTEAAAMAPGNAQMARRLDREVTMFATRNQAIGNSKTAENLADMDAMRVDPTIIANLLSGDFGGAARNALARAGHTLSGYTPAVREELARILLSRGQNADLRRLLDEAVQRVELNRLLLSNAGRGIFGALAVAPAATGQTGSARP